MEVGVKGPQVKESRHPPEVEKVKEMDFSLRDSRRNKSCQHLDFLKL